MTSLTQVDFFDGYFEALSQQGIEYAILHTYTEYPESIHSDVDYCVRDCDLQKVILFVSNYCKLSGWHLVQIMQHEVKAFFCICVSKEDPSAFVQLDVCSHYMREGRLLIKDEVLLKDVQLYKDKGFFVPSKYVELAYILWKAAAKDKPIENIDARVKELTHNDNGLHENDAIDELVQILGASDTNADITSIFEELSSLYKRLPLLTRIGQVKRIFHRVRYPSGCYCVIKNDKGTEDFYQSIKSLTAHAFRKCDVVEKARYRDYLKIARSTLLLVSEKPSLPMRLINKLLQCEYTIVDSDESKAVKKLNEELEQRTLQQWGLSS